MDPLAMLGEKPVDPAISTSVRAMQEESVCTVGKAVTAMTGGGCALLETGAALLLAAEDRILLVIEEETLLTAEERTLLVTLDAVLFAPPHVKVVCIVAVLLAGFASVGESVDVKLLMASHPTPVPDVNERLRPRAPFGTS